MDIALLESLGIEVLRVDEKCARHAAAPTFFYLPHLEGHMTDNLLAANLGQPAQQQEQHQPQQSSQVSAGQQQEQQQGQLTQQAGGQQGAGNMTRQKVEEDRGGASSSGAAGSGATEESGRSTLHNVVLLGNAFSTYWDRWGGGAGAGFGGGGRKGGSSSAQSASGSAQARGHLQAGPKRPDVMLGLLAAGRVAQAAVPDGRDFLDVPSAFNDMALHTFPSQ